MANYVKPEPRPGEKDHGDALSMGLKPLPEPKRDEEGFLALMRERAVSAQSWWDENFDLAEENVDFAAGKHWRPSDKAARADEPTLTINTVAAQIETVCGEQRQNRPAIHVHPADDLGARQEYAVGAGKRQRRRRRQACSCN